MSKRSCKTLSIKLKQEIIKAVENGGKKKDIAIKYNIAPSTLTSIFKKRELYAQLPSTSKQKRQKPCEYPDLEKALMTWFHQCRATNIPVGGALFREKAKQFAEKLGISNFKGSDGWFDRFKKRNNVSFRKICGESAAVNEAVCEDWTGKLLKLIEGYESKNVFNADETGLFFKCLPAHTFSFKGEKCHGGKNSKDRITLLLAVNMDGSEKLTPLLIGKFAKPRCFKNLKTLPMTYRSNRKAWMTSDLFNEWLQSLNEEMSNQKRKILLFIDNCPAHNIQRDFSNIQIEFLPPNSTARLQPIDKGIIQNFKTFYRKEVVKEILECMEDGKAYKISLFSAMNMAYKAWKNVSKPTIQNCFRACGFIRDSHGMVTHEEVLSISGWEKIFPNEDNRVSFNEYVHFDDQLVTSGVLNDEEILDCCFENSENDEIDEEVPIISSKIAKESISNIRNYFMQTSVDESIFEVIIKLENKIDQLRVSKLHQTQITQYF